jgi:polar amino acid transport system substrate-binding protein
MRVEKSAVARGLRVWLASRAVAVVGLGCLAAMSASAATLDRIRESGHLRLGYLADARPFSYRAESGAAEGYGVALCQKVAEQVKSELKLSDLAVDWVAVAPDDRLRDVQAGGVDLLCTPMTPTLGRRQEVSFSLPVFASGVRAALRANAPVALREALGDTPSLQPVWRGSPAAKLLEKKSFAVVSGTTSQSWLASRLDSFQIDAKTVPVPDYRTGLRQLTEGKVDVLFGDRSAILGAMDADTSRKVTILDRLLTHEALALPLARGDDDFRLAVDRALAALYSSGDFPQLYRQWFGDFDDNTRTLFLWATPPQ